MSLPRFISLAFTVLLFALPSRVLAQDGALPGDLDDDGIVSVEDVNGLCTAIGNSNEEMVDRTDVNRDDRVDFDDMEVVLESIGSLRGDTNLDGLVQFRDFVKHSANFGRDSDAPDSQPVFWSDGDFDCDGQVAFADFLYIVNNYGEFPGSPLVEFEGVPEPASFNLAILSGILMLLVRRKRMNS